MKPQECIKCATAFCDSCIKTWKTSSPNGQCPMKCKDATYTDLHRLVKAKLLKTKFFCPIPNCELSK